MDNISKYILEKYQKRNTKKEKEKFYLWLDNYLKDHDITTRLEVGKGGKNIVIGNPDTAKIILTAHYDTCAVLPIPNFIMPTTIWAFILSQIIMSIILLFFILVAIGFTNLLLPDILHINFIVSLVVFSIWAYFGYGNKNTANDNTSGVIVVLETLLSLAKESRQNVCFVLFDNEEKGLLGSRAFAKTHNKIKEETLIFNFDCVSDGDNICFFAPKKQKNNIKLEEYLIEMFSKTESKKTIKYIKNG